MSDLISREEVLKHQYAFADESGIGLSFHDVVNVSTIEKIPSVNAIILEGVTNGDWVKSLLNPREDQIKIYGDSVEIEIQRTGINFSCDLEWWDAPCGTKSPHVNSTASKEDSILAKVKDEIEDTGAYEQEVTGKTEFLKGIEYCLSVIEKFSSGN